MKKYRVEAFIIPTNVTDKVESNDKNGEKVAIPTKVETLDGSSQQLKKISIIDRDAQDVLNVSSESRVELSSSSEFSAVFFDINEHIYDEIKAGERKQVATEAPVPAMEVKPVSHKATTTNAAATAVEQQRASKFARVSDEPIYDEPFVGSFISRSSSSISSSSSSRDKDDNAACEATPGTRWTLASSKYKRFGIVAPKLPKRSSSLQSISEDIESLEESQLLLKLQPQQQQQQQQRYQQLQQVCCHGRKDGGCLAGSSQRPEDISDEIFKENWMQRLDALRKLETLLKDKEVALLSRERLLFKKEKELRILERLVKDKMRQAELYAKRCKKSLISSGSEQSLGLLQDARSQQQEEGSKPFSRSELASSSSIELLESKVRAKDSLLLDATGNCIEEPAARQQQQQQQLSRQSIARKSCDTSSSRYPIAQMTNRMLGSSTRSRSRTTRQKVRYEDIDTTLSADVGDDNSFVVTSKKFDPLIFKKPTAFTRSASERRPRSEQRVATVHVERVEPLVVDHADLNDELLLLSSCTNVLEEKALRKMSENIIASQNQESKFLNYGLIDGDAVSTENLDKKEMTNQKRFSYLNLESINRTIKSKIKAKDRPISWSEDTDDWLKKKRLAYNTATSKHAADNTGNKENFDRQNKIQKPINKKKDNKKFSIFR